MFTGEPSAVVRPTYIPMIHPTDLPVVGEAFSLYTMVLSLHRPTEYHTGTLTYVTVSLRSERTNVRTQDDMTGIVSIVYGNEGYIKGLY